MTWGRFRYLCREASRKWRRRLRRALCLRHRWIIEDIQPPYVRYGCGCGAVKVEDRSR